MAYGACWLVGFFIVLIGGSTPGVKGASGHRGMVHGTGLSSSEDVCDKW